MLAKKKTKKRQSGITVAKKQYTDKRKVKLGEMRALKSKRIREHNTKTKKMPKAERDAARRDFKKKVKWGNRSYGLMRPNVPIWGGDPDARWVPRAPLQRGYMGF